MVTGLAAAEAVEALGMCDVVMAEATGGVDVTPVSNQLHYNHNTTAISCRNLVRFGSVTTEFRT